MTKRELKKAVDTNASMPTASPEAVRERAERKRRVGKRAHDLYAPNDPESEKSAAEKTAEAKVIRALLGTVSFILGTGSAANEPSYSTPVLQDSSKIRSKRSDPLPVPSSPSIYDSTSLASALDKGIYAQQAPSTLKSNFTITAPVRNVLTPHAARSFNELADPRNLHTPVQSIETYRPEQNPVFAPVSYGGGKPAGTSFAQGAGLTSTLPPAEPLSFKFNAPNKVKASKPKGPKLEQPAPQPTIDMPGLTGGLLADPEAPKTTFGFSLAEPTLQPR